MQQWRRSGTHGIHNAGNKLNRSVGYLLLFYCLWRQFHGNSCETFHAKSSSQKTIAHPTISDFNEIWYTASMDKYNNPNFFIFSILDLVQFLQPFENYSECWHSSNCGKTVEQHCLLQLSIPRQLKTLKTSDSPYLLTISWGFKKCGLKLSSTYQCLWNSCLKLKK
jgi:hypothetical protein